MKNNNIFKIGAIGLIIGLSGCSSMKTVNPLNGETEFTYAAKGTAIGAGVGAGVGAIAGGGVGAGIGAGVGALAGGYYGYTMDEAREKLSEDLEQYGISVIDENGVTVVRIDNDILFKKSSNVLKDSDIAALDKFSEIIKGLNDQGAIIKITGHTDDTGSQPFNISLSKHRAKNVAYYLFKKGIPAQSIDYSGVADLVPAVDEQTPEARALNRRVEIRVIPSQSAD